MGYNTADPPSGSRLCLSLHFCFCLIKITVCLLFYRPELVFDKFGIKVTSEPPSDENGVIEQIIKVESGLVSGQIVLFIDNTSGETITLKDITLMWSVNFFDYSEIRQIGAYEGNLQPGNSCSFIVCFSGFGLPSMFSPGYEF